MLGWLAEKRIADAVARGELDNLPGANKPLPRDALDPLVPAHLRVAMRVIHAAGGLPAELVLRKELNRINADLNQLIKQKENVSQDVEFERERLRRKRLELLIMLRSSTVST